MMYPDGLQFPAAHAGEKRAIAKAAEAGWGVRGHERAIGGKSNNGKSRAGIYKMPKAALKWVLQDPMSAPSSPVSPPLTR